MGTDACVSDVLLCIILVPSPTWAEGTVLCLCVCYHKIGVKVNYLNI